MDLNKNDRGYNWSIIFIIIGVLLTIAYLIPQVIHEHQIEEDRLQRIEKSINKQQEDLDSLEDSFIRIQEDLNGNQIPHTTHSN